VARLEDGEQQIGKNVEDKNGSRTIYNCVSRGYVAKQRRFDSVERGKVEGDPRDAHSVVQVCRH